MGNFYTRGGILGERMEEVTKPTDPNGLVLEAWAQGFMVGALLVMICITLSNIRRGVILHKLILVEVCKIRATSNLYAAILYAALLRPRARHIHFQ